MLVFILIFGSYGGFLIWDTHKVTAFCEDVHPGATLKTLRILAQKHGVVGIPGDNKPGIHDEQEKAWVFYVFVPETFGDTACMVRYNDDGVMLSATMTY